jgi:hypothetical protein
MYNNDIRNRFIEHRARGISLDKVTSLLGISRTTAVEWNRKYKARVADLRALQYEAVLQRAGADYERDVHLAMAQLNRIREVLARRKVEHLSTEYLYNLEAMAFARMEKLMRLAELPDHGSAEVSEPAEPETDVPAPSPNVNATEGDDPVRLPQFVPDLFNRSPEAENRSVSGPFPTQKHGGGTSDLQSDSALSRVESSAITARAETLSPDIASPEEPSAETQNPAKTQPFTSQNSGGHNSSLLPVDGEGRAMCPHSAESQSEIPNLKSKIESAFAPLRPCVESLAISARAEALSPDSASPEGPSPLNDPDLCNSGSGAIGNSNIHGSWNPPPNLSSGRAAAPSAVASPQFPSKIVDPDSKIPEPSESDPALEGESIPVSPYETTREWLERQGIKVSRIPKGARVIIAP